MTSPTTDPLEALLRLCAGAAPEPWYPREYVATTGTPSATLDLGLEKLRLGGLIRLTDWVRDRGQGYVLTPAGVSALRNPRELQRVREGRTTMPASEQTSSGARPGTDAWGRGEAIRDAMVNPDPPVVTYLIFAANVVVFIAGLVLAPAAGVPQGEYLSGFGNAEKYLGLLHQLGSVSATDILQGQWWRLLSACFAHAGLLHIGMNMWGLYVLGPLMERAFGHVRYLVLYLLSGLGGSCLAVLLQGDVAMVGASGALCGLLGAMGAWTLLNRRYLPSQVASSWIRSVTINAFILIAISWGFSGMISWSGHLGGALTGLVAGALLNYQRWGRTWQQALAVVGLVVLPLAAFGAVLRAQSFSKKWVTIQEAQEEKDVSPEARADFALLKQNLLPETDGVARRAESVCFAAYDSIKDAAKNAASGQPDADTARKWRNSLEQIRPECVKAAQQFDDVGRLHGAAEAARKTRRDQFQELATFAEMLANCLQAGHPCSADERKALSKQHDQVAEKHNHWIDLKEALNP